MTPFFDPVVKRWVAARLPLCDDFGESTAMGVEHGAEIVAGVVFHDWQPDAGVIEMTVAADNPKWLTRTVARTAFGYVFDDVGCQMVVARQRVDNIRARKIWRALGASEAIIPRMYGREIDGSIMTLTDDVWRASKFERSAGNG